MREVALEGKTDMAPALFNDCQDGDYRILARIPWLSQEADSTGADDEHASLMRYATDGLFSVTSLVTRCAVMRAVVFKPSTTRICLHRDRVSKSASYTLATSGL